jgi:PTS system nitrogen regulatory IIA component
VHLDLKRLVRPETVRLDLTSPDKEGAIADLVELLAAAGEIADRQAVLDAVLERERKMSTGMQHGIAVPHAKTDAVERIAAAVGIHAKGVEFQSLDGRPTHIIIVTVSPQDSSGPHVQFLAQISRILTARKTRERLLRAKSKQEVIAILTASR